MKRAFLWTVGVLLVLLLVMGSLVNVLSAGADPLPAPDLASEITLPDGSARTLGEIIEPWAGKPRPAKKLALEQRSEHTVIEVGASGELTAEQEAFIARVIEESLREAAEPPDGSDPFELAEWHRRVGDPEQASLLYRAIPEGHPRWGRAQRRLAWDCLTKAQDEPALAVPYAHKAIADDPTDGNAWQDAARVYAATLGLPVD